MRLRTMLILGVLGTSLVLRADSCLVEQEEVHVVLGTEVPATWVSQGFTDGTGMRVDTIDVNPTADILDAIDDLDLPGDLVSINVTGASFEVLASTGHDARRFGGITVNGQALLEFNTPTNAAGTTAFATASGTPIDPMTTTPQLRLRAPGLNLINNRLNQLLQDYQAGLPIDESLLELDYVATWTSVPAPTQSQPDDFTWTTDLLVQIIRSAEVDTFDP